MVTIVWGYFGDSGVVRVEVNSIRERILKVRELMGFGANFIEFYHHRGPFYVACD